MLASSTPQRPLLVHGRPVVGVYTRIDDWMLPLQAVLEGTFSSGYLVTTHECRGRLSTARLIDGDLTGILTLEESISGFEVKLVLHRPGRQDRLTLVYRTQNDSALDSSELHLECADPEASFHHRGSPNDDLTTGRVRSNLGNGCASLMSRRWSI